MTTWRGRAEPVFPPLGPRGWVRVLLRGLPLAMLVFGGLILMLMLRLLERPIYGLHRPWTQYITQFVCRCTFVILGIGFRVEGAPMRERGAVVSNHSSWLDIFALNARKRIYFVSKAEVAGWPGIGWLARATGTVFISRYARDAAAQKSMFEARLLAGHKLLFFPEGTSTDGSLVLAFKSTLFAALFTQNLRDTLSVQPVTVVYSGPGGAEDRFYGWWGDMDFAPHLLQVLGARRQGSVRLIYHAPLKVADFTDRKALAKACEDAVHSGMGTAE